MSDSEEKTIKIVIRESPARRGEGGSYYSHRLVAEVDRDVSIYEEERWGIDGEWEDIPASYSNQVILGSGDIERIVEALSRFRDAAGSDS